jgi:hypothetical protein
LAQSPTEVEDYILEAFRKINYLRDRPSEKATDSLKLLNKQLLRYLLKAGKNNDLLLTADMKRVSVEDQMNVLTSDDGKVRIFNWDTETGGAVNYFDAIVLFRVNDTTIATAVLNDVAKKPDGSGEERNGEWYTKLNTVTNKAGRVYYLFSSKAMYSIKSKEFFLDAYTIYGGKLHPAPLFIYKNTTLYSLNVACVSTLTNDVNPEIRVTGNKQRVLAPIINKIDEYPTGKYAVYVFDGNNYVFDKNAH